MGKKKTSVLVCDDHPVVRQGIINTIENDKSFIVSHECENGKEALIKIKNHTPDIAILDISMPSLSGIEVLGKLNKENSPTKVIIMTMYDDEEYFTEAMDLGAKGYLLKENALSDLIKCLQTVANGKYFICPSFSNSLVNSYKTKNENSLLDILTFAEIKVLKLISENKTSNIIAKELNISRRTVESHRHNMHIKLNLQGYNQLFQFAIENKYSF